MRQTITAVQLSISTRATAGTYQVRAACGGEDAQANLELPEPVLALAGRLARPDASAPLGDPAFLGRALGRALLAPPIRDLVLRCAKQARGRLQIQLQIAPPELAALPWELATIGISKPWSPALRQEYGLVRVSRGARAAPPAPVAGPLRVLAVAAPGEDQQLDALDSALSAATRAGQIELTLVHDATPATLERALRETDPHVLHIGAPIALGERGTPRLSLRRGLDAADLVDLLADSADLRLVTIAGAQGDASEAATATLALAAPLLAADLPAVIAFGGALPARMSARFAAACYGKLAGGAPADLAVTVGRQALAQEGAASGCWGLVQLRMAPGGERLFVRRGGSRAAPARLPRRAIAAGAAVALAGALLLGNRAFGGHAGPTAVAQTLPTASLQQATPTLSESASNDGLWKALFGPGVTPTPAQAPSAADLPQPTAYATYLTKADDTLASIAQRMGSDVDALVLLNHLDARAPLRAGHPLVVPVYRSGDAGAGGLVINRGNPAERKVALTFDIEIDDKTLYDILDILRARGLHGTFFVTGRWVQAFPDAARAIVRDGHEIGNHSLTHPYFSRIGLDGATSELRETERIVEQTTGITARPFFRFPYGDSTRDTANVVAREGYVAYHWSADDDAISGWLDRATQKPEDGSGGILLMHGRKSTVTALPGWLDRLNALGLQPTTLSDALK